LSFKKQLNISNQILSLQFPIKFSKLQEKINLHFLRQKFNKQSKINIGMYLINTNSREIILDKLKLKLTEKEINTILYLNNSEKPVRINELQDKVWGYQSELETHTVETHIHRLRKKIKEKFKDDKLILSTKNGYKII
jgi:DNA-binding response OmpR family regulator